MERLCFQVKSRIRSIHGTDVDGHTYKGAHDRTWRAMQEYGYEYDSVAGGYEMEYYTYAGFIEPMEGGDRL